MLLAFIVRNLGPSRDKGRGGEGGDIFDAKRDGEGYDTNDGDGFEPLMPRTSIARAERSRLSESEAGAIAQASARCVARWRREGTGGERDNGNGNGNKSQDLDDISVDYEILEAATDGFDELDGLIGTGGSCRVFKGIVADFPVAIKVMHGDAVKPSKQAWEDKQVKAEIELLCRIDHPHINRLLGVSLDGPQRCIVLEYMNG